VIESPTFASVKKRPANALSVALVLVLLLLGASGIYLGAQNASLGSANAQLRSSSSSLQGNLSALDSELSDLDSQHSQLQSSNASLASRVVELNSTLMTSARLVQSLSTLSNRTAIVTNSAVVVGPTTPLAVPVTNSVVNFTANFPGYVIVTIVTNPASVGEMYVSVWSNPTVCSEQRLFCAAGATPSFLGPGDSFLVPVLAGPVQIGLGNYNNYTVSASVTVVYYD
jgi:hypothetical protein